jgi:steroid delta-isomerase-like uncharacterized protein
MYMTKLLAKFIFSYILLSALPAFAAGVCPQGTGPGAALLERYVAAVNGHDTAPFAEIFAESYIQHSGRSPSGLPAQVENFKRIIASMPDVRIKVEDCIVGGDRLVARTTYSATHTQAIRGIAPTGKAFSFRTIDIWRVENGKLAEHWDLTDTAEVLQKLKSE